MYTRVNYVYASHSFKNVHLIVRLDRFFLIRFPDHIISIQFERSIW